MIIITAIQLVKRQFYCDVIFVQIFGTLYCICVCHFISCGGLGRALVRSLISHDHDLTKGFNSP